MSRSRPSTCTIIPSSSNTPWTVTAHDRADPSRFRKPIGISVRPPLLLQAIHEIAPVFHVPVKSRLGGADERFDRIISEKAGEAPVAVGDGAFQRRPENGRWKPIQELGLAHGDVRARVHHHVNTRNRTEADPKTIPEGSGLGASNRPSGRAAGMHRPSQPTPESNSCKLCASNVRAGDPKPHEMAAVPFRPTCQPFPKKVLDSGLGGQFRDGFGERLH